MSEIIRVPDIGSGAGRVIELFVKAGDSVEADQSLLTLESDKASMEIPCPKAGVIKALLIKLGDELREGDVLLELEAAEAAAPAPVAAPAPAPAAAPAAAPVVAAAPVAAAAAPAASVSSSVEVHVPDIGSSGKARVIEVLVATGDSLDAEQGLIVLESDKASMEIPCPQAGTVASLAVKVGDELATGDLILTLQVSVATPAAAAPAVAPAAPAPAPVAPAPAAPAAAAAPAVAAAVPDGHAHVAPGRHGIKVHAGPAVRCLARELGVDLQEVTPTGPRERILKEDVQNHVKAMLLKARTTPVAAAAPAAGAGIPPIPLIDFSKFGEIEEVPMTRLMQVGAANLHRSWLNVPHVTQHESADISELEAFRKTQGKAAEKAGVKLTALPFLLKACAQVLKEMPDFNSSLNPKGDGLIRKQYVHIGFAVDTPEGLLVPVIRNVDQKGLLQLAGEAAALAEKARSKKLSADEMQGACFTISSLGHIGGTGFSPIVNAPEVAILGVSKATMQPVWNGEGFTPRLMLPLSLSYDHRVINGAAACRFTARLAELLAEIRSLLL